MNILKNHKVLLFNNPKCGSTSLRQYVQPYSVNLNCIPFWSPDCYHYEYYNDYQMKRLNNLRRTQAYKLKKTDNSFSTIHTHITPLDVSRIIKDSSEESLVHEFNDYDKICFTRNPWARVYSLWKMLRSENNDLKKSFTDFVCDLEQHLALDFHPVIRYVIEGTKSFVSDTKGNITVDHIFKIENTVEFTDYMLEAHNIPSGNFRHLNSTTTNLPSYTSQYNSKTIKIIESRYQWEIDYFGYKFAE